MKLIIRDTADLASQYVARYIIKRVNEFAPTSSRPFVLGLPTGSSPDTIYKYLVRAYLDGEISFANVVTFNMDEYVALPEEHPESYHSFMYKHFFSHVDINPANVHLLNGNAPDLVAECTQYERQIRQAGGIDLFLGGIGPDGHVAFNEPGSSLKSRTRVATLADDTIRANSRFFGNDISKVPKQALTVGVQTVMEAREVILIITGAHKAMALQKTVEGAVSQMWTASALQMHEEAIIACDEDATGEMLVKTVKYFKSIEQIEAQVANNTEAQQTHQHKALNDIRMDEWRGKLTEQRPLRIDTKTAPKQHVEVNELTPDSMSSRILDSDHSAFDMDSNENGKRKRGSMEMPRSMSPKTTRTNDRPEGITSAEKAVEASQMDEDLVITNMHSRVSTFAA